MSGLSKHMMHPYDDLDLTIGDLHEMIKMYNSYDTVYLEKTDGYNIHVGYVNGETRFFRNMKDIASGGMSIDGMRAKWLNNKHIQNTYVECGEIISAVMPELQKHMPDNVGAFYTLNCECIRGLTNVVPYMDTRVIVHNIWKWQEGRAPEVIDLPIEFEGYADRHVYVDNIVRCMGLHDLDRSGAMTKSLCTAIGDPHDSITNHAMTLREYYTKEIKRLCDRSDYEWVSNNLSFHHVIERLFGDLSYKLKDLREDYKDKDIAGFIDGDGKLIMHLARKPLINLFIYIGDDVLSRACGYLNQANKYDICSVMSHTIDGAIRHIVDNPKSTDEYNRVIDAAMNFDLHHGTINALEGVVYEYKGNLYKLTGSFALINKFVGYAMRDGFKIF